MSKRASYFLFNSMLGPETQTSVELKQKGYYSTYLNISNELTHEDDNCITSERLSDLFQALSTHCKSLFNTFTTSLVEVVFHSKMISLLELFSGLGQLLQVAQVSHKMRYQFLDLHMNQREKDSTSISDNVAITL